MTAISTPASCSIHTHSIHCDGKDTLADMAQAAYEAGVKYFGFSGHSHTLLPWDEGGVLPADTSAYQEETQRLRRFYDGRMEVLIGVEQDSCSLQPVQDEASGKSGCIDWSPEVFRKSLRELAGGDALLLAERYYRDVAAIAARKPTILGHADLIVKFNRGGRFFDEEAPRYRSAALEALHAANPEKTLLEINTGEAIEAPPIQPSSSYGSGVLWVGG